MLDLAPEAPWRCPENCPKYERTLIDSSFDQGTLARTAVEDEPDESPEAIADLLDDAEMIVDDAAPEAIRDIDGARGQSRKWWQPWEAAASRRRRRLAPQQPLTLSSVARVVSGRVVSGRCGFRMCGFRTRGFRTCGFRTLVPFPDAWFPDCGGFRMCGFRRVISDGVIA